AYLRHRLAVAGRQGELPFDDAAVRRLQRASGGVPRRLNLLAGRALLGAWAQGRARAGAAEVRQAEQELPLADRRATARRGGPASSRSTARTLAAGSLALGLLAGLAAGVAAALWPGSGEPLPPAAAARAAAASSAGVVADRQPSTSPPVESAASAPETTARAVEPVGAPQWPVRPASRDAQWARLALDWGVTLPDVEPCTAGQVHGLSCHRSPALTLATVRALDRPGLVTLVPAQGDPVTARLRGLSDTHAFLDFDTAADTAADAAGGVHGAAQMSGPTMQAWPLPVFAAAWRGDFSTWWRRSDALPDGREARAAAVAAAQLGTDRSTLEGPLQTAAIQAFQRAQGLTADGVPGTLTLMQWNRATGVDEPRLLRVGEAPVAPAPAHPSGTAARASQPATTP
ncbi:MAG: peptidoglycan-binding protein, partial [Rubrivivax sp.]